MFFFQLIDNYVGGRGRIKEWATKDTTVSNIFVGAATMQDTGNYTCAAPAIAANASVNLYVLVDGKNDFTSFLGAGKLSLVFFGTPYSYAYVMCKSKFPTFKIT